MSLKEKLYSENFLIIVIFFFSLFFNQYFGNRGVFPLDSFSHFDTGYRILNGEMPFRDFWVVSGPLIDFLQAFLFLIFDVNWQTYLLNASILNGIFAAFTYKLFLEFELDKKSSFFYTICLSILAYPSSGTPFVDHHSTFFSIISIYLLIFAIKKEKIIYWFFIPVFLSFAFLSKQVPAAYILFSILFIIIYNFIFRDGKNIITNNKIFLILFCSSITIFILLIIFLNFFEISVQSFMDQYINYPREIGRIRYLELNYDFKKIVLDFKFIHLIFILLLIMNIYSLIKNKKFFKKINFKLFLISSLLLFSLIQHQIVTKNQIFIFFLIPLYSAFVHIELLNLPLKYKNYLILLLFSICLFTTFKYHTRFNIERKFHELNNVNFSNAVKATILSERFKGLDWITPDKNNKEEILDELNSIKKNIDILKKDKSKKMVFTNYSFFSIVLQDSVNSPTRWFPGDNSAFPQKESKSYKIYKNFLLKKIQNKKITNIFVINDVSEKNLLNYLNEECFNKIKVSEHMFKYEINRNCSDLYGKQ